MENVERERLVISNEEITPVDYVQVRRKRRQVCFGVAVACCLGIGLSLAVAIPLVNQQQKAPTSDANLQRTGPLMMSGKGVDPAFHVEGEPVVEKKQVEEEEETTTVTTTAADEEQQTTERHHRLTWPTDWTIRTLIPRRTTTVTESTPIPTTTASWLPADCPRVPHSVHRDPIDVEALADTVWYELHRIQTFNAPVYVDHVSCSKLTFNTTGLNASTDASVLLSWEEGRFFHRSRKNVTLSLHRNDSSSNDWLETIVGNASEDAPTGPAQFSFLARIAGFLLTYECFPSVSWFPAPGYVIRVFADEPRPSYNGQRLAEALLYLPELWGLNAAEVSPISIRQRRCDIDLGYD